MSNKTTDDTIIKAVSMLYGLQHDMAEQREYIKDLLEECKTCTDIIEHKSHEIEVLEYELEEARKGISVLRTSWVNLLRFWE